MREKQQKHQLFIQFIMYGSSYMGPGVARY
jgi:hypothetical protein